MISQTELIRLHDELAALAAAGDEASAHKLLAARFAELPEDLQADLLTRALLSSIRTEVEETKRIAEVQSKALSIAKTLESIKEQIGKEL